MTWLDGVEKRRWWLLLVGVGLFLLLPTGFLPLTETTEARYAEIAREMVVSGNYLEPVFNGVKHFHKPPLTYWMIAAGLKIFGINDFGARFFGVIAALATLIYLHRLALLVSNDRILARRTTLLFTSTLLFLAVSRIAATDIYLTCCTVASLYHLFARRFTEERQLRQALWIALWLGLGFLAKGPVIFLFTLLPLLVAKWVDPGHRRLFSWGETGVALLAFVAVALPWYLLVIDKNPGLFDYFFQVQTADRMLTNRFNRAQPVWYFLPVLLGGFLPWSYFFVGGLRGLKQLDLRARTILVYVLVPFLFFSLNRSKLAPYILPLMPMTALFTAQACGVLAMPRLRRVAFWTLASLPLVVLAAAIFLVPLRAHPLVLVVAALLVALSLRPLWRSLANESFFLQGALTLLLFSLVAHTLVFLATPEFKAYEALTAAINQRDPQRRIDVLVYRDFLPSISFYRNRLAIMALGLERETDFQNDAAFRQTTLDSKAAVQLALTGKEEIFLVAKSDAFKDFQNLIPSSCEPLFQQRRYSAYFCRLTPFATGR